MDDTYKQEANELTEFLLEGHLAASADAKLVAEAILLGFAYHAGRGRKDMTEGMNRESIGAVLENILDVIDRKSSA